ncbi:MAG: carboxylesterase family protein, partial [Bacteroidales bacterium]
MKRNVTLFAAVAVSALVALGGCCGGNSVRKSAKNVSGGEILSGNDVATAQTQYGKVAGYLESGVNIFKGIPYAKAERFMPPTAPDSWEGVR